MTNMKKSAAIGWKAAANLCEEWAKDFDETPLKLFEGEEASENSAYWRRLGGVISRREWTEADIRFSLRGLITAKTQSQSAISAILGAPEIADEAKALAAFLESKVSHAYRVDFLEGPGNYVTIRKLSRGKE